MSIHPGTLMGRVSLTVRSLEEQIDFYRQTLGFVLHARQDATASLGTGTRELLHLVEAPGARRFPRVTGLYHFAVLFPDQAQLAIAVARLFALRYPNYPTDHVLTKTTNLSDAEGNGIELYAESPEDGTWHMEGDSFYARRADGTLSDGREPLDVEALFSHLDEGQRLDVAIPPETRIGHVHLHIRDVGEAVDFYHGVLDFDIMGRADRLGAAFVSAGGYHHHLGLNTWQGVGIPAPPPGALGLRDFTILVPDQAELVRLRERLAAAGAPVEEADGEVVTADPCRNVVVLRVQGEQPA